MSENKPLPKHAFEQTLIELAWKDDKFRNKLIEDPKAAIKEKFGFEFGSMNLKVVEEAENEMIIALPPNPKGTDEELSPEQLNEVAGGTAYNTINVWQTCTCAFSAGYEHSCQLNSYCGQFYNN